MIFPINRNSILTYLRSSMPIPYLGSSCRIRTTRNRARRLMLLSATLHKPFNNLPAQRIESHAILVHPAPAQPTARADSQLRPQTPPTNTQWTSNRSSRTQIAISRNCLRSSIWKRGRASRNPPSRLSWRGRGWRSPPFCLDSSDWPLFPVPLRNSRDAWNRC